MGEYPLAWAACCANESVYNLLIDSNADPDAQDTFGNMILHMVVVCDKLVGSVNRSVLWLILYVNNFFFYRTCSDMPCVIQGYRQKTGLLM